MKGNITKRFSSNSKGRRFWCIAAIVVSIIVVVLMLNRCGSTPTSSGDGDIMPTIQFNSNDGYVSPSDSGVQIEAASGFIMDAGVTAQSVKFNNSKSNDCAFIVTLYLADGTEIYKSDYLYPGDSINEIELKRTLKAGLYKDALMVYQLYSIESHKPINRCEFPIEIQTK